MFWKARQLHAGNHRLFNLAPAEYHRGIQNMRHSCGVERNE